MERPSFQGVWKKKIWFSVQCSYSDFNKQNNTEGPKFKVGDNIRISRYRNIFAKNLSNWSEEVFAIKRVKNTVPWTYVVSDLKGEEVTKNKIKEFRVQKVIKRKGDKLYVRWKGHDNSLNNWIDKKDMV